MKLTVPAALALLAAPGCIERSITVESDPPGAAVRLNGRAVGTTPVTVPFRHYGVYRVELKKSGHETLETVEPVLAPAYARFPLCIFTEFLWPGTLRDEHYLSYEIEEPRTPERAGLLERAASSGQRRGPDRAAGNIP
jgi:hypothetical protein